MKPPAGAAAALRRYLLPLGCMMVAAGTLPALAGPPAFGEGWKLNAKTSRLSFQSVKNNSVVETSTFATYGGTIAPDGEATVSIQLDSVDTGVDLRNVRMRFLFFETFRFPEAIVRVRIDPAIIPELTTKRRIRLPLDYELDLHGITQTLSAETVVTLVSENLVSVASAAPITLGTALFQLDDGIRKLEDAAQVSIVPSGSVTFDFVFDRVGVASTTGAARPDPARTAVETSGDFSEEECAGRFEILSRTGAVYFATGSAELDSESVPLLTALIAIADRCPDLGIVVEGHTDSAGSDSFNQRLSEARAASVAAYLAQNGVAGERMRAIGYGETRPVAPNDTEPDRSRNRRIQFVAAPS